MKKFSLIMMSLLLLGTFTGCASHQKKVMNKVVEEVTKSEEATKSKKMTGKDKYMIDYENKTDVQICRETADQFFESILEGNADKMKAVINGMDAMRISLCKYTTYEEGKGWREFFEDLEWAERDSDDKIKFTEENGHQEAYMVYQVRVKSGETKELKTSMQPI
ncbi:MAG: hypothetical protein PUH12_05220 [Lachnospiraceae bacterium]|nr:hypothetical protein [Lachnospiraceae bacterium]